MSLPGRLYILTTWLLAIFLLIGTPTTEWNGDVFSYHDKLAHIVLFGVLAGLLVYTFNKAKLKKGRIIFISFCLSAVYSLFCVYYQNFVPGRDVSLYDFVAGLAGIIIALTYVYYRILKVKK